MKNKRLIIILSLLTLVLFIPLIAMQFTDEVNWDIADFIVMGILLYTVGFLCEFALRKIRNVDNRIFIIGLIVVLFLLIWAELAVGIFGSPFAGS